MSDLDNAKAKLKRIVANKGHVRLYIIASVIWMVITGPLLWRPLPYIDNDLLVGADTIAQPGRVDPSDRVIQECPAPDLTKPDDLAYSMCHNQVTARVEAEVSNARSSQLTFWIMTTLGVPILLPLLAGLLVLASAATLQWVRNGYRDSA